MIDVEATTEALHDLRRARRQNRLADVHWIDALYRVYMVGLVGVILVMLASGQLPDDRLTDAEAIDFANEAPMWLGLLFAVAVGIGLRSGGRGGPLVLEAPVVMHELNAPVPRAEVVGAPPSSSCASWPSPARSSAPSSASSPPAPARSTSSPP